MALFGANKRINVERLNTATGLYSPLLSNILCRYEERDHSHKSFREQGDPENHTLFSLVVHQIDIQETDRVIVPAEGNRTFVVAGVTTLDDFYGKHLEIPMREIASIVHVVVTRRVLEPILNQPNYDPLFREYDGDPSKVYTDTDITVIIKDHREFSERYKLQLSGGKIVDMDFIMTIEINQEMDTDDRIIYNGQQYLVKWVTDEVFERFVGLKLDMHSTPSNP